MIRLNLSFFPNLCLAGHMKGARSGHAVIFDGAQFLVIGGYYRKTQNCVPNGKTITCTEQQLGLGTYSAYPEFMLVDENYEKYCQKAVQET